MKPASPPRESSSRGHRAKESSPQIKICGITTPETARFCAQAGVHALGLVFYPKSPRHLSHTRARAITAALPREVTPVGVFVNEDLSTILETLDATGIRAVQLHGQEAPALVQALMEKGIPTAKAFYMTADPHVNRANQYPPATRVVEWGKGILPGGNGQGWEKIPALPESPHPWVIAGGLTPKNVGSLIANARPDGVDVSSGVESAPGIKDHHKIISFIRAVAATRLPAPGKDIFTC